MSPPPFSSSGPSSTTHPHSQMTGPPHHRNDYTSIYDQRCAAWGNEETIDLLYLWRDNLQAIQCARNRPAWEHVAHQMALKGHSRTWEQCKTRIHTLVQKFRRTKLPNQPQSQSTDMWRQTAVYEILNEILRNIPGLPWTYEDGQEQPSGSPNTTPTSLAQLQAAAAAATAINGMNVRSILSNGVKVERADTFYHEAVSSDSAGSSHEEVVAYQGEPGEVPPRNQRRLQSSVPKAALYSSAIKYSTPAAAAAAAQRSAFVFATIGGNADDEDENSYNNEYQEDDRDSRDRDISPQMISNSGAPEERGVIVRGGAHGGQHVESSSPSIGREVTISTNAHRPRAHTFSTSNHSNNQIAASLILLSQQQPGPAAVPSHSPQPPRPASVSPTPHDLSVHPHHATPITVSPESSLPPAPHSSHSHLSSGLNLLSATCHSAAIAASAAGNPPLASEYVPPEPANPEGGALVEGRPPPIKKQRLLDSLLQSRSSTTSPKNLSFYHRNGSDGSRAVQEEVSQANDARSFQTFQISSATPNLPHPAHPPAPHPNSPTSSSQDDVPHSSRIRSYPHHRYSPNSRHNPASPTSNLPYASNHASLVHSATSDSTPGSTHGHAYHRMNLPAPTGSPYRPTGLVATALSAASVPPSALQPANSNETDLKTLLHSTIRHQESVAVRMESLVENFTSIQRDMNAKWIEFLKHRDVLYEEQRKEERKFMLAVINSLSSGQVLNVDSESKNDERKPSCSVIPFTNVTTNGTLASLTSHQQAGHQMANHQPFAFTSRAEEFHKLDSTTGVASTSLNATPTTSSSHAFVTSEADIQSSDQSHHHASPLVNGASSSSPGSLLLPAPRATRAPPGVTSLGPGVSHEANEVQSSDVSPKEQKLNSETMS